MPQIQTTAKPLQLLTDIRKRPWFVHDPESLMPVAMSLLRGETPADRQTEPKAFEYSEEPSGLSLQQDASPSMVAVIPIVGTIIKWDTWCTYGAMTYARAIRRAAGNPDICAIVLDIDSGGGAANAIAVLREAIAYAKEAGKPVIAHVDFCASLAYWLASQCDAIFCNDLLSEVGSIGAFCQIIDDTGAWEKDGYKVIDVYADESPDKNRPYREAIEGNDALLKKELSHVVGQFHAEVKAGRPEIKADAPGVFTGAMFYPAEAQTLGMINGIATLAECIENAAIRAQFN
jgi:protease-4